MVCHSNDELEAASNDGTVEQEDAASAPSNDDKGICHDGEKAGHAQDVGHGERIRDLRHGEEVGLIRCSGEVR